MKKNVFYVILAGGSGQRLWPLSTSKLPKQFIPFAGQQTLFDLTLNRIEATKTNSDAIVTVINQNYIDLIRPEYQDIIDSIITEPVGRNTAPAILNAAYHAQSTNPDGVIVALAADHYIPDTKAFATTMHAAIEYARMHNVIGLIGIKPTYPATGFGYIQASQTSHSSSSATLQFHEKPDLATATNYLARNDMWWNASIVIAPISVLLQEYATHAPSLFHDFQDVRAGNKHYHDLASISVDYAVLEKSKKIIVFPSHFEWHDVGTLATFVTLQERITPHKNPPININGQHNVSNVHDRTVICVGVNNLSIIQTESILLIANNDQPEALRTATTIVQDKGIKNVCV